MIDSLSTDPTNPDQYYQQLLTDYKEETREFKFPEDDKPKTQYWDEYRARWGDRESAIEGFAILKLKEGIKRFKEKSE